MISRLPAEQFLEKAKQVPMIDVRSPAEFAHGHIPGAHNLPLFDDLERADVGTLFHRAGRNEAVKKGLEIAGPKMRYYVDEALRLARNGELLVYCWRGGMRSDSMAWLFNTSGIGAYVLDKGYKGFRRHFKASFERPQPMIVIGGMTGSGKTKLLEMISGLGFQMIDLEQIANHKGSVFGNLGLPEQPTNEHFENLLGMAWLDLDPTKPVFLEDESFNIGRDSIPKVFYERMQSSPLFYIEMPREQRVDRLFLEYGRFSPELLSRMIDKIDRRLGGEKAKEARQAIAEGRLKDAIRISLEYYDKAYLFDLEKKKRQNILNFKLDAKDGWEGVVKAILDQLPVKMN